MSLASAVRALLAADSTLMAALTGGIYEGLEITRQDTPAAFDANKEILPCGLVKAGSEAKNGPYLNSVQSVMQIYFYQRTGSTQIETASARVCTLLNESRLANTWQILYLNQTPLSRDDGLKCAMLMQRYAIYWRKV